MAYIKFDDDNHMLGIMTQNTDGTHAVKAITRERVIMRNEDAKPDDWVVLDPTEIVPIPVVYPEQITQSIRSVEIFAGKVALKSAVPLPKDQTDPSSSILGTLVGYRYISQDFITRLAEQTQAHVNVFVGSDLYVGTLPEFSEIPISYSKELQ